MQRVHVDGDVAMTGNFRVKSRTISSSVDVTAIQRMFSPGGDINTHAARWEREIRILAVIRSPHRTGNLAARHQSNHPTAFQHVYANVWNDAPYSKFVHDGTTGPIHGRRGWMGVRPFPHSWYTETTPRHTVRGQRAKPWLLNSMRDVLARHGVL